MTILDYTGPYRIYQDYTGLNGTILECIRLHRNIKDSRNKQDNSVLNKAMQKNRGLQSIV